MTGRNEVCPCGSGKKYKYCCGHLSKDVSRASAAPPHAVGSRLAADVVSQADINTLIALFSAGRFAELEVRAQALIQAHPQFGFLWKALSVALQAQEKEALYALQMAAQLLPDDAEAHNNLGVALRKVGRQSEALDSHRRALHLKNDYFEAHYNLAMALQDVERDEEALQSLRRAIVMTPNYAEAYNNLGNTLRCLDRLDDAAESYRRAFAINPALAEVNSNLGTVLRDLGQFDDAIDCFRAALQSDAEMAELHNNLGNALRETGRFTESVHSFHRALELKPDFSQVHNNLATVMCDVGALDEAFISIRRAIAADPSYPEARLNHAYFLLQNGEYEAGWREYEYRWKTVNSGPIREFKQPLWLGDADLRGKTILLHAEQGIGDTLQFVRYVPQVIALGAKVILEVHTEVKTLIENSLDSSRVTILASHQPLSHFDFHCPLLSLPLACRAMSPGSLSVTPYLHANPSLKLQWRDKLGESKGLRVGLVWAGGARRHNVDANIVDGMRSMNWKQMSLLLNVAGVEFFSLQLGAEAVAQLNGEPRVKDFTGELHDFQDTAALVENLDLVISVDTSTAHLAGAIGKPVWMLNRFNTCWRWGNDVETTAWYPTMRIFRQAILGDWNSVMLRVQEELRRRITG